jgi:hypothetical protein
MIVHCSTDKPWGIHASLRGNSCTRCGWAADIAAPTARSVAPPALTVITGGLSADPRAAAA